MGTLDGSENDPAVAAAVFRATKNIVYSVTRTNAMNIGNATVIAVTPAWQIALYAVTGVFAALTGICVFMFMRSKKRSK